MKQLKHFEQKAAEQGKGKAVNIAALKGKTNSMLDVIMLQGIQSGHNTVDALAQYLRMTPEKLKEQTQNTGLFSIVGNNVHTSFY